MKSMTTKVAKPITNGCKYGTLPVIEFFFWNANKILGSLEKNKPETHIFLGGLMHQSFVCLKPKWKSEANDLLVSRSKFHLVGTC